MKKNYRELVEENFQKVKVMLYHPIELCIELW